MNNPFERRPGAACEEAFRGLQVQLEAMKESERADDRAFCRELEAGKMLGVLIATDAEGVRHTLFAFSGQIGGAVYRAKPGKISDGLLAVARSGFYRQGFVGPVFDYLEPGGYFKRKEAEITGLNAEIARYEEGIFSNARNEYELAKERLNAEVTEYKEKCRLSKLERDGRRKTLMADAHDREAWPSVDHELAAMIRRSQFEKAELHRLKKRSAAALAPYAARLEEARRQLDAMKEQRRAASEALQTWLFTNFRLLNARGESRSLSEIFAGTPMRIPPSGAGECCAPKLLQEAYRRGWNPEEIAEYWYGRSKEGEVRLHGEQYPACRGKCLPVLTWMLQGLTVEPPLDADTPGAGGCEPEIIYENRWFCVVSKPSGLLSVPGKGASLSVEEWLTRHYGAGCGVRMAHRLDQDTSGLLIATFGAEALKVMQGLFATRKVRKTYAAVLEGDYLSLGLPPQGRIELPLSADWLDRPRQRVDPENGKETVSEYEFVGVTDGRSRVMLHPLTGRTHQLRVHAASAEGLGMPIVGDRLYGKSSVRGTERLHLHAQSIEFTFPIDGEHYYFEVPAPF